MTFEDFEALYLDAYSSGLKACAAFRPNEVTGSILKSASTEKDPATTPVKFVGTVHNTGPIETAWTNIEGEKEIMELIHEASGVKIHKAEDIVPGQRYAVAAPRVPRPPAVDGKTHKIKWGEHAVYITINDLHGMPFEIFLNSKDSAHYAWSVALTRMISAVWQKGGETGFISEELKAIADPRGGMWMNGQYVPSLQAAIGIVIDDHIAGRVHNMELQPEQEHPGVRFCPKCTSTNVWFPKANCLTCRNCLFSTCD